MTQPIRVFVNQQAVAVPPGATVREAVMRCDPELARLLRDGGAYVTDGVGRPVEPAGSVEPGAILRIVRTARQAPPSDGA